jgi:hypothetical protein
LSRWIGGGWVSGGGERWERCSYSLDDARDDLVGRDMAVVLEEIADGLVDRGERRVVPAYCAVFGADLEGGWAGHCLVDGRDVQGLLVLGRLRVSQQDRRCV